MQLMGFPEVGAVRYPSQVVADWDAVIGHLRSHPEEASYSVNDGPLNQSDPFVSSIAGTQRNELPVYLALKNKTTPITMLALQAFIDAFPDAFTTINIQMFHEVYKDLPDNLRDLLFAQNPLFIRSKLLQLLGLPSKGVSHEREHNEGTTVDWASVLEHALTRPEEAATATQFKFGTAQPFYPLFVAISIERSIDNGVTRPRAIPESLPAIEAIMDAFPQALDSDELFACTTSGVPDDVFGATARRKPDLARTQLFQLLGLSRSPWSPSGLSRLDRRQPQPDWDAVETHLRLFPEEASVLDLMPRNGPQEQHQSPLERALFSYRPVPHTLVEHLLDIAPEVVLRQDSAALVEACWNRFVDDATVELIFECNPSQAGYVLESTYALHKAVQMQRGLQLVRNLIRAYPDALEIPTDESAVVLLKARSPQMVELLLDEGVHHGVGGAGGLFLDGFEEKRQTLDHFIELAFVDGFWEMLCVCLRHAVACQHGVADRASCMLVHAAIEFGKKLAVVERACYEHPEVITQMDTIGRTPLVIAIDVLHNLHGQNDDDMSDFLWEDNPTRLVSLLIQGVSIPDSRGRLPLHLAIDKGLPSEVITNLATSNGAALLVRDTVTFLLPFMMAASQDHLESTFHMLRTAPQALYTSNRSSMDCQDLPC